jgi:hypothetical protein
MQWRSEHPSSVLQHRPLNIQTYLHAATSCPLTKLPFKILKFCSVRIERKCDFLQYLIKDYKVQSELPATLCAEFAARDLNCEICLLIFGWGFVLLGSIKQSRGNKLM